MAWRQLPAGLLCATLCLAQTFSQFFPSGLKAYFDLSQAQVDAILRANDDYQQAVSSKQQRIFQVQFEISGETRKYPLDPMALGVRYVELEQLRRQSNDEFAKTRDLVRAVLSEAQKAKLKTLEDARKLQPLVSEAECQNLLDPGVRGAFFAFFLVGPVANLPTASYCPSQLNFSFSTDLRDYLILSADQMNQIAGQNATLNLNASTKRGRIGQVLNEISAELAKDVLDPMALGVRYAEIESLNRQINDAQRSVRQKDRAALNDAQRAKVKTLEDSRALQTLISEAECEKMLDPSLSGLNSPVPTGVVSVSGVFTGVIPSLPNAQRSCGPSFTFTGPPPLIP